MRTLTGLPASPGIAIGPVFVYQPESLSASRRSVDDVQDELKRFHAALDIAKQQLLDLRTHTESAAGAAAAAIFEAHYMFLEDAALLDAVQERIAAGLGAEAALTAELEKFASILVNLDDLSMRERAADVHDAGQQVLRVLAGAEDNMLATLRSPAIVAAVNLNPSDVVRMLSSSVLGLAIAHGGPTSHTAILARTLGLPAVVGLDESTLAALSIGTEVILDGLNGQLIVEPDAPTLAVFRAQREQSLRSGEAGRSSAHLPALTRDGTRIEVAANISTLESAQAALEFGADGVGLLRTEFLFLDRAAVPGEEEQYEVYRALALRLGAQPLTIRTLDMGGDKSSLSDSGLPGRFPGWRGIRVSLAEPEAFKIQLRAILRAGLGCNVRLMFPLITQVEEVHAARRLLDEARSELRERGTPFAEPIEVGIMIEVPAAALCAATLAREVDFLSIGSNDLIQYTLAVDRMNERVAYLYDPLHPAVLRLIQMVIDGAHREGKWAGLCGEMASLPEALPLLVGLGLDEFSVGEAFIPAIKQRIRLLDRQSLRGLALRALDLPSAGEVRELVRGYF